MFYVSMCKLLKNLILHFITSKVWIIRINKACKLLNSFILQELWLWVFCLW